MQALPEPVTSRGRACSSADAGQPAVRNDIQLLRVVAGCEVDASFFALQRAAEDKFVQPHHTYRPTSWIGAICVGLGLASPMSKSLNCKVQISQS